MQRDLSFVTNDAIQGREGIQKELIFEGREVTTDRKMSIYAVLAKVGNKGREIWKHPLKYK